MFDSVPCKMYLNVDNTKMYKVLLGDEEPVQLQNELGVIQNWSQRTF